VKPVRQAFALAAMFTIDAFRDWFVYLVLGVFPISFFIMLYLIGGAALGQHALYGFIISVCANAGVVGLPQKVVFYKHIRKLQDVFVAAPISPLVYMGGHALSRLAWSLPGFLMFVVILLVCGFMHVGAIPLMLVVVVATWLVGSALGFMLGTFVSNPHLISSIANMLGMALVLFPPVIYPMHLIPAGLRWAAALIPTASAAELLRLAGGVSETGMNPLYLWLVLGFWTVACSLLVGRASRWRDA